MMAKAKKLCVKRLRRHSPSQGSCSVTHQLSVVEEETVVAAFDNNEYSSASTTTVSSHSSSSSWHADDIDARSERFIGNFREYLRLEGQKSIEEYNAMLTHRV